VYRGRGENYGLGVEVVSGLLNLDQLRLLRMSWVVQVECATRVSAGTWPFAGYHAKGLMFSL